MPLATVCMPGAPHAVNRYTNKGNSQVVAYCHSHDAEDMMLDDYELEADDEASE